MPRLVVCDSGADLEGGSTDGNISRTITIRPAEVPSRIHAGVADFTTNAVVALIHNGGSFREPTTMDNRVERLIGNARVSTSELELDLQIDALLAHGVEKQHLFYDKISGAKEDRPGLAACMEELRRGDTFAMRRIEDIENNAVSLRQVARQSKRAIVNSYVSRDDRTQLPAASGSSASLASGRALKRQNTACVPLSRQFWHSAV